MDGFAGNSATVCVCLASSNVSTSYAESVLAMVNVLMMVNVYSAPCVKPYTTTLPSYGSSSSASIVIDVSTLDPPEVVAITFAETNSRNVPKFPNR